MNKTTWIISIDSQYISPARLLKFFGTLEDVKQKIYDLYLEYYNEECQYLAEIDEVPADKVAFDAIRYYDPMRINLSGIFHDVGEYQDELYPIEFQAIALESIAD